MGQEAFVDGEEAFGADGLGQTIEDSLVKVSILVVHARHDGIYPQMSAGNFMYLR